MKKTLLILFLLVEFVLNSFATLPAPERLIYNGDTLAFEAHPLYNLYGDSIPPPLRIFGFETTGSSACWNGYIAYWEISGQQLYLTDIVSCRYAEDSIKADLKELFGNKFIKGKVKADWVSQNVIAGKGGIAYEGGDDRSWKTELELSFDKGKLIKTTIYDNSKSRQRSLSDIELMQFIPSNINWSLVDAFPDSVWQKRVNIRFSANEDGLIDDVAVVKSEAPLILEQEAIRVVKAIPKWEIYFKRGKHVRKYWNIPITYSEKSRNKYSTNN
jgi:hypothetical protein